MTEQYIFNVDAYEPFYEKLDDLHEKYVNHLLLSGVAPKGTALESVKMTKNINANRSYCERVVGGLVNVQPDIIARLVEEGAARIECIFTKVNDKEHLNHTYMIQNVMDWPRTGGFSCQIWYLGEISIDRIKAHWNE